MQFTTQLILLYLDQEMVRKPTSVAKIRSWPGVAKALTSMTLKKFRRVAVRAQPKLLKHHTSLIMI